VHKEELGSAAIEVGEAILTRGKTAATRLVPKEIEMSKKIGFFYVLATLALIVIGWTSSHPKLQALQAGGGIATPADGYTVHVTAPHFVHGKVMGPYHHYCKVLTPDPYIVCQIYDSADPNGTMSQIEFIIAKKLTRPAIDRQTWNRLWHDHAVEIAGGRVKVLDLPPDKAKEVADLVATTDGIIYSFNFNGHFPDGTITMAQAVGHKPLAAAEYEQSRKEAKQSR
jgi:hypothetical protein